MAFLDLDAVKAHLSIEIEDTSFDTRLSALIGAAARACEIKTGRWIEPDDAPEGSVTAPFSDTDLDLLRQAGLIMIADWFENPTGEGKVPQAIGWILEQLRDYSGRGG